MRTCLLPIEIRCKMRSWQQKLCLARRTWVLPLDVDHPAGKRVDHRNLTRRSIFSSNSRRSCSLLNSRICQFSSPLTMYKIRLMLLAKAKAQCTTWKTWTTSSRRLKKISAKSSTRWTSRTSIACPRLPLQSSKRSRTKWRHSLMSKMSKRRCQTHAPILLRFWAL